MIRRIAITLIALCFLGSLFIVDFFSTQATSSILSDFSAVYGGGLVSRFGCEICHRPGSDGLNEYGEDLSGAVGFGCQDYNPPSTHSIIEERGTCVAGHAPGYTMPLASNCVGCHGSGLSGGNAPSCYSCHGKNWQDGGSGSCPDFNAPGDHTKLKDEDGCGAYHKEGLEEPFQSGCTDCHGSNLRGWSGPSCYTCHGNEWDDDAPPAEPASASVHPSGLGADDFRKVENEDSDGDGFSNKEEIEALTNPGDSASLPLGENTYVVQMPKEWQRSWLTTRGEIGVRITSENGVAVDNTKPISISIGKNSLSTTKIKMRARGTAEARFQKALIYCLFAGLSGKKATVSIDGSLVDGTEFSLSGEISLIGSAPKQLSELRVSAKPKELSDGADVKLEIRGQDAKRVDLDSKLFAVGVFRHLKLSDVERNGKAVVISLPARDVERLFGTLNPDVSYTLGIRGSGADDGSTFCISATLKVESDGGGGQDPCFNFSPPASHTVKRKSGTCTYLHMPGASDPIGNGCAACHGGDLKGTTFAPSCTLCHGVKW